MKTILKVQKDGVNTLKEEILSHSSSKLKKIFVIASDVKETGYEIIEECLIDLKARKFIAFGIDKKNTTKKMLENILKYTKTVYVWDNNGEVEFKSNIFVFEYDDEAIVYLVQGSLTDSMLDTDFNIYTKISFDLIQDKKEYEEYVDTLTKQIKESFVKLDKEYITELIDKKLIFTTKQYTHVVPSIAELLGKTDNQENIDEKEEIKPLPKIQLDDVDLDSLEIDLGDIELDDGDVEVELEEQNNNEKEETLTQVETEAFGLENEELIDETEESYIVSDEAIDMESLVLESNVIKLDKNDIERKNKEQKAKKAVSEKQSAKKINLTKVSNIIMEMGQKPTKGKDITKIKVPNYIKDMIPNFFEIMEDATLVKSEAGEYKQIKIKLEVIDVNNSNKYVDNDASLRQKVGQTYIEFDSEALENVMYEELDIARIIKLSRTSYHIEIIPKGIEEYLMWDKMCTNTFRGSNRQYGLM